MIHNFPKMQERIRDLQTLATAERERAEKWRWFAALFGLLLLVVSLFLVWLLWQLKIVADARLQMGGAATMALMLSGLRRWRVRADEVSWEVEMGAILSDSGVVHIDETVEAEDGVAALRAATAIARQRIATKERYHPDAVHLAIDALGAEEIARPDEYGVEVEDLGEVSAAEAMRAAGQANLFGGVA